MPVVHDSVQTTAKIAVTFKQLVREVNKRAISETVRQAVTPSALSKLHPVKPRQDLGTAVKHLLNGTHNAVHNGTVRRMFCLSSFAACLLADNSTWPLAVASPLTN